MDPDAHAQLLATLHAELRRLAERELLRHPGAAVSPTTLVHEVYTQLLSRQDVSCPEPARLACVARAMRGVLIDLAGRHQALNLGTGFEIIAPDTPLAADDGIESPLLALSDALDELARHQPQLAEIIDLKYFCGFSFAEIAQLRGAPERIIQRDWQKGRLLLYRTLQDIAAGEPPP